MAPWVGSTAICISIKKTWAITKNVWTRAVIVIVSVGGYEYGRKKPYRSLDLYNTRSRNRSLLTRGISKLRYVIGAIKHYILFILHVEQCATWEA
jgi:hypothetical protein